MDEKALIQAAKKGDLEAFNQLVLKYQDKVYNQAFWLLGSPDLAEDITQDTFLKAYQNLAKFREDSFRSWVLRIASNACYDELRRSKRQPTEDLVQRRNDGEQVDTEEWLIDSSVSIEDTVAQAEFSAMLRQQLEKLPEHYRSILVLVDIQELDYLEAAGILRIPIGTVKSRLARARQRMRDSLSGMPEILLSEFLPERERGLAA